MKQSPVVIQHPLLSQYARHGFFTRIGGVSQGEYAALNCGMKSGDKAEYIAENRRIVAEHMGTEADLLWGGLQVHGTHIKRISRASHAICEADGAVTDDPDVVISVVTADCAPVLLSTKDGKIVGAAHAGWRGAADGILETVVDRMIGLGAESQDIVAVVGPCIAVTHYEVRDDMRQQVLEQDPLGQIFFTPVRDGFYLFDLGRYCVDRLRRKHVGIAALLGRDTFSDPQHFFSHRRRVVENGTVIGHQISAIACKGENGENVKGIMKKGYN